MGLQGLDITEERASALEEIAIEAIQRNTKTKEKLKKKEQSISERQHTFRLEEEEEGHKNCLKTESLKNFSNLINSQFQEAQ